MVFHHSYDSKGLESKLTIDHLLVTRFTGVTGSIFDTGSILELFDWARGADRNRLRNRI